jgi:hypothetical protein
MSDSSERPSAFETRPVAGAKRPPTPRTAKEAARSHGAQPKIARVRSTKSQQSAEALDETRSQQISRQSSILSQPIEEDPETSEEETDEEMAHAPTSAAPQAQTPAPTLGGLPPVVQILTDDLRTLMQGALEAVVMERAQARDQQADQ